MCRLVTKVGRICNCRIYSNFNLCPEVCREGNGISCDIVEELKESEVNDYCDSCIADKKEKAEKTKKKADQEKRKKAEEQKKSLNPEEGA